MSVGWQRQYETDAVCDFAMAVKIFAEEKPNDAKLQAFARKCRLQALMVMAQEDEDRKTGNMALDRLADCEACKRFNDGKRPCDENEGRKCKWAMPAEFRKTVIRYFGDEGKHFLEWAGKIIAKREARTCTK